tara:strand:+ start:107 stop:247 length:141 start_codon:yes stop_codon:yes gene_type:complete
MAVEMVVIHAYQEVIFMLIFILAVALEATLEMVAMVEALMVMGKGK